jgi:hypothetical protein
MKLEEKYLTVRQHIECLEQNTMNLLFAKTNKFRGWLHDRYGAVIPGFTTSHLILTETHDLVMDALASVMSGERSAPWAGPVETADFVDWLVYDVIKSSTSHMHERGQRGTDMVDNKHQDFNLDNRNATKDADSSLYEVLFLLAEAHPKNKRLTTVLAMLIAGEKKTDIAKTLLVSNATVTNDLKLIRELAMEYLEQSSEP